MASEDVNVVDIFRGAEKVEVLGKLPLLLWEYIDHGRMLIRGLDDPSLDVNSSVNILERILDILVGACEYLDKTDLGDRLSGHSQELAALVSGDISHEEFKTSYESRMSKLQEIAGARPDKSGEGILPRDFLEKELSRAEKAKLGRSADVVVDVKLLDKVRDYLLSDLMTEGISSVLVIDNAGSLIANVGDKLDLDAISLAAVAAANFAATERIARLIGEADFALLFYKGANESFHFSRVGRDYIIVTIFNNSLSLGLLRLKVSEVAKALDKMLPKREV